MKEFIKKQYYRLTSLIKKRPVLSFSIALVLLFLIIIAGSLLSPKPEKVKEEQIVKPVQIYKIGTAPRIAVQAKVEKTGVIKITALTAGVIKSISVKEGDRVEKGANLINLASNYGGGNAALVQASIASTQYKNILDTYQTQKDLIQRQKDLANSVQTNEENLRNISSQTIEETQKAIDLNQDILNRLSANIKKLEETNTNGTNDATILQTKQLQSQFQSALNSLSQSLRLTQYQSSNTNPPADISRAQKDITLKQLEIQEKMLDLNKEVSKLQLVLAEINAEAMHPTAPFAGRIQRIYIKKGQAVTPGTLLIMISGDRDKVSAVAMVSKNTAKHVSNIENSILFINNMTYEERPFFISDEATDNQLYTIHYLIPEHLSSYVTDNDYITISIPIGYPDTLSTVPYIPLDSIYQSQDQAYVFVIEKGKAISRTITLGQIYGRFVEVKTGLIAGDRVILDRNIIAGDRISPVN